MPRNVKREKRKDTARRKKSRKNVRRHARNVPPSPAQVTLSPMGMATVFVLATPLIMATAIAVALATLLLMGSATVHVLETP